MRKVVYRLLGWAVWIVVSASILVGATLKTTPQNWKSWGLENLLESVQETAWLILPILVILIPAIKWLQSRVGVPWVWEVIRHNLDAFRDHVFEKQKGEPVHHHRATLFKHRRGWLIPVARSGDTTTKVRFRATRESLDNAEGIAGQTCTRNVVLTVEGLPDISQNKKEGALAEYAEKSFVTVEWLQRNKKTFPARSFCGIPVEVRGELWGVIVLDSRSERPFGRGPEKTYRLFGRQLGKLLEKA